MARSLQELFIESRGQPVQVGGVLVRQGDVLPITKGRVTIRFLRGQAKDHGVRLETKNGWIELTDGSRAMVVDTWRSPEFPDEISYRVSCPQKDLDMWNIYRLFHTGGLVTEDMWTGGAGMVLLEGCPNRRVYGCSAGGSGEFAPDTLVVEVEWHEE